ncbi:hypothetical protein IJ182_09875 [bacterium]|nr:hypothetical protein [bacterium]
MKKGHLRLVISNENNEEKKEMADYWKRLKNFVECIFISKNEKIILIKDSLIKIYRDYEKTTGIVDIPYFVRADIRISQIIKEKKINYYYTRLKKFNNKNWY